MPAGIVADAITAIVATTSEAIRSADKRLPSAETEAKLINAQRRRPTRYI
jgi:hypothetical protein